MHETINKYRVFPRIFLICFTLATGTSIHWYLSFPLDYITTCNETLLLGMLDRKHSVEESERLSCRPIAALGRPHGYTALVSTLVGACGVVFSFYASTGSTARKDPEGAEQNNV